TVLLEDLAGVRGAIHVAERIAEELEAPLELRGQRIFISTSVGIALSTHSGLQPGSLLRNADVAMYQAKKEGRARFRLFDQSMHAQALERLELENDLRRAIEQEELRVHYQPAVCLRTGELAGVEALVRWEHPVRGLLSPREFIPLAEETGFIDSLGQWVLRTSCKQACEWRRLYPAAGSLIMSVNLSVKQFQQKDLTMQLERILQETGLDPHYLQLEITESAVAEDVERTVKLLWALKDLKVRIAIDDFGTGYSSLHSLRSFPLDALKVDKAFVEGLGQSSRDAAIAQMIIDLAHAVGMEAIGEGVETAEQIARLREMKCDAAQGYYFSEPLTGEEMGTLLDDAPSRLAGASLKGGRFTASGH
ncbi:MAG: putative bifunctional diguanylate cyclase/phosphodiesterase, partial [Rubrobacteraceae bacterium]